MDPRQDFTILARLDSLEMAITQALQTFDAADTAEDEQIVAAVTVLRTAFEHQVPEGDWVTARGLMALRQQVKTQADARYRLLKDIDRELERRMRDEGQLTVKTDFGRAEIIVRTNFDIDEAAFTRWLKVELPMLVRERPVPNAVDALKAQGGQVTDGGKFLTGDGEVVDGISVDGQEVFRVMPLAAKAGPRAVVTADRVREMAAERNEEAAR